MYVYMNTVKKKKHCYYVLFLQFFEVASSLWRFKSIFANCEALWHQKVIFNEAWKHNSINSPCWC